MALRLIILIALTTHVFIVLCAADGQETSSVSSTTSARTIGEASSSGKKKCVKVKKCPKNEEFSYCTHSISRAQYCSQKGQMLRQQEENTPCKEGCVCKEGFLRNSKGSCIPESKCNATCGPNEVLVKCPVDCASDYCPTREQESSTCAKPKEDECPPPVCKCAFDYRRAYNGTCIPTEKCPPFSCSARPNEEYVACPPLCPSDACGQPRLTGICPYRILIRLECNPKCQCKDGYGRSNEICVPFAHCPNLCSENEEYNSCTQAVCRQQNCSSRNDPVACPAISEDSCNKGCVCKENFYRNANGTCVPNDQCEANLCSENEEYNSCTQAVCRQQNCSSRNDPVACPAISEGSCNKGCVCKENYYRNSNDICVASDQCEDYKCPNPNEEYTKSSRTPKCPILGTCKSIVARIRCDEPETSGCICKGGYYRLNETSSCIPMCECPEMANTAECQ